MTAMNQEQVQQSNSQEQEPAQASSKAWEKGNGGHWRAAGRVQFQIGRLAATPNALQVLEEAGVNWLSLVDRHMRGDFGNVCPDDAQSNREAIEHGFRILSSYPVGMADVWVITEADRSVTTLLLPSDY